MKISNHNILHDKKCFKKILRLKFTLQSTVLTKIACSYSEKTICLICIKTGARSLIFIIKEINLHF